MISLYKIYIELTIIFDNKKKFFFWDETTIIHLDAKIPESSDIEFEVDEFPSEIPSIAIKSFYFICSKKSKTLYFEMSWTTGELCGIVHL